MLFSSFLLLPLASAAPALSGSAAGDIAELSVSQWSSIQSGFVDTFRSLGSGSWNKAEDVIDDLEAIANAHVQGGDETQLTIWQQLKADPNSFSKLVKIIEFEGKAIKYLDDKDLQITFFAPNNDALTPPHHHHHHDDGDDDLILTELLNAPSLTTLSTLLDNEPSLTAQGHDDNDDDDDEHKKRRKEIFRKIAGKILQYHGLPKAYTARELAENSTIATALKADDGSFGGLHRRIRIQKSLVPPALTVNFYAKVLVSDGKARNGIVHTLNHPLLPPGSLFEELFLFPDEFSTLTSAIQGVHGRSLFDYGYDKEASKPGEPKFHGAGLATVFAPKNTAFLALPFKLKLYLFSPFGHHALMKVLAYHYVPHTLLLSEVLYVEKHKDSQSSSADGFTDLLSSYESFNMGDDPSFHKEFEITPALANSTLKIEIDKTKFLPVEGAIKTTIKVNGQLVEIIDGLARNGAAHVIGKLLVPPHHHHDHKGADISALDSWTNWEEWLPAWAAEA